MQPPGAIAGATPADTPASTTLLHAAVATVAAAVAAGATTSSASAPDDSSPPGECRLLGPFALLVQGALGGLALLSLVYKRWRERPQRPLKIFLFDVSKQVVGSVLTHIVNILMSMLTSGRFSIKVDPIAVAGVAAREDGYVPNPCSSYLLNLAIDTTLGIPILIVLLRITTGLIAYTWLGKPRESIQSGYYGNPPNTRWWVKQSLIYFIGLLGMKVCVLIIFIMMPFISKIGDWALSWTDGNERLQIAFSMMIFPLIMNCIQYYIIDSFIKKDESSSSAHERLPTEDPDEGPGRYDDQARPGDDHHGHEDDDEVDDEITEAQKRKQATESEYDPDTDGQAPTIAGSGSSRQTELGTNLPTELYPKE